MSLQIKGKALGPTEALQLSLPWWVFPFFPNVHTAPPPFPAPTPRYFGKTLPALLVLACHSDACNFSGLPVIPEKLPPLPLLPHKGCWTFRPILGHSCSLHRPLNGLYILRSQQVPGELSVSAGTWLTRQTAHIYVVGRKEG